MNELQQRENIKKYQKEITVEGYNNLTEKYT